MTNPKVDFFFSKDGKWAEAYSTLRTLVLECGIKEELKWGVPCYTLNKANVVLIHGFKEYCALLFHKGALLSGPEKILIQQTENVQSARQLRFTSNEEIIQKAATIKAYIFEAIEVERAGLKVEMKKTEDYKVPEEFSAVLAEDEALKVAFGKLTPGRQRAYLFYFSQPKLSTTRVSRVANSIEKILAGKGLED